LTQPRDFTSLQIKLAPLLLLFAPPPSLVEESYGAGKIQTRTQILKVEKMQPRDFETIDAVLFFFVSSFSCEVLSFSHGPKMRSSPVSVVVQCSIYNFYGKFAQGHLAKRNTIGCTSFLLGKEFKA